MEKLFVPYNIAVMAKENDFDEHTKFGIITSLYDKNENHTFYANYRFQGSGLNDGYIYAPTHQQLSDWFREKYNIYVYVKALKPGIYKSYINDDEIIESDGYYFTYNKAFEEAFKLIKDK